MSVSSEAREKAHQALSDYLSKNGLKQTRQREAILDTFLSSSGHVTSEELYEAVRSENPEIGAATVYRSMKLFCEAGLANSHHFRDGVTLYEPRGKHHDHLVCMECGEVIEFRNDTIEREQEKVAAQFGFELTHHRHILYGTCLKKDCKHRA